MVGSPLVVPFWDNFWNLSARGLVPTHSVLSGGLSTSEVVFVSVGRSSAELGTPQRRQQPAILQVDQFVSLSSKVSCRCVIPIAFKHCWISSP